MPAVVDAEHRHAAQKLREIYATYADAEDLINIGAFAPGSNRRIDGAISLIDRINEFLVQPVRQKTPFPETVRRLTALHQAWDKLLSPPRSETASVKN
jgi:flagellum-specific ATP synthase